MENRYQEALEYFMGATIPNNLTYDEVKNMEGEECAKHFMAIKELIYKQEKIQMARFKE